MEALSSKLVRQWKFLSPRVLQPYSTATTNIPTSSSENGVKHSSLYKRISMAGDPRSSMSSILDQWVSEGNKIGTNELHSLVIRLRYYKRYSHALQVSAWMSEKFSHNFLVKDAAIQLKLISQVQGLDQAEKHFGSLPESLRGPPIYNALLNCYADAGSLKKAEDLMQKMKEMGFTRRTVPYNIMLKLYLQMEMYGKVEQILQEMKEHGFGGDTYAGKVQLAAYSRVGKVKEMEVVLMKLEADPGNIMRFPEYISAANGYLRRGFVDKALVVLKRAEHLACGKEKKHVYHCLLTLYAHAKVKEEVFRIWELYKSSWDVYNKGRLCMVSALVILDDLEGAQKIIDEWVEGLYADQRVDFRVINPLLRAYCKKGDLEMARALVDKLREKSCQEPKRSTWEILGTGYCSYNQMEDAVKTMRKALVADGVEWRFHKASLIRCLDFLKMKGNPEEFNDFTSLLEEHGYAPENLLSENSGDTRAQSCLDDREEEDDMESQGVIIRTS